MNNKLLDILKEQDDISEQQLLDYINGQLGVEEQHAIELKLAGNEMMRDAEEGLAQVKEKDQLRHITAQLNANLAAQLKERRKKKRPELPNQTLLITTTFLILVLIVIAFMVIYKLKNP